MSEVKDTSADYETLVGHINEANIESTLADFIDEVYEYKPSVKPKKLDPAYPEDWQNLQVNFPTMEDFISFMKKLEEFPNPKMKDFAFSKDKSKDNLLSFFGD